MEREGNITRVGWPRYVGGAGLAARASRLVRAVIGARGEGTMGSLSIGVSEGDIHVIISDFIS